MKKLKRNKGITLVALVVTIIVLLILAGITISSLTGSGLLEKVKQASENNKYANALEKVKLAVLASYDETGNLNDEFLKNNLNAIEGKEGALVEKENNITVRVDGFNFLVSKLSGEITRTDVEIADGEVDGSRDNEETIKALQGKIESLQTTIGELQTTLANVYTKTEIDNNIYTKTEVDSMIPETSSGSGGTIYTVTGTTPSSTQSGQWIKVADYPTGLNMNNCVIIGAEVYDTNGTCNMMNYANQIMCKKGTDGFYIVTNASYFMSCSFKIYLQKID